MLLNIRLAYHKTGRARFLSHLDTMRVFQQSLTRAKLPLRYSEGFNPHIVLSIALPLGVGMESVTERLDFGVTENMNMGTLPAALNAVLPEGFLVSRAAAGGRSVSQITFARYEITADSQAKPERVLALFASSAVVEKRNKRKELVPTDIVPFIRGVSCEPSGDKLRLTATLSAREPVLNPEYVAEAWRLYLDPEAAFSFKRTALLDGDEKLFDNL
ncbi:MAG: TIGR03936 family radical SAM-associated protein [Oscillospiraceae bacterium]|jgi:radical SAM-linked protein|nr:TIGR03936 family radical SAM-associated protein [Oscillospiraceae bacterium]